MLFLLLILFLVTTKAAELFAYRTDYTIFDVYVNGASLPYLAKAWIINNAPNPSQVKIYGCTGANILGGPGILQAGDTVQRTYDPLPPHSMLYYFVRLYAIDNWQVGETISVMIDGQNVFSFEPYYIISSEGTPLCNVVALNDKEMYMRGGFSHSSTSVTIKMVSSGNSAAMYGFRDLKVRVSANDPIITRSACITPDNPTSIGLSGTCQCIRGKFYYTLTSSCTTCDPACGECFGPTSTECIVCNFGYSFDPDLNACVKCNTNCFICYGSDKNECAQCYSSVTLDWTRNCVTTCPSPYVSTGIGPKACNSPCYPNGYLLWDNSCSASCVSPLIPNTQGDAMFCDSPCGKTSSDYLYWDGSCQSTCPYYGHTSNNYRLCDACQPGNFMYGNSTCLPYCNYPYKQRSLGGSQFCDSPCSGDAQYLYTQDWKCKSKCVYPYKIVYGYGCELDLSTESASSTGGLTDFTSNTGSIGSIIAKAVSIFNFNNPTAMLLASFANMLQYLKYVGIQYPPKLKHSFNLQLEPPINLTPDPPAEIQNLVNEYPIPDNFADYNLNSSFLINYWDSIFTFLALGFAIVVVCVCKFYSKFWKPFAYIYAKLQPIFKWNFSLSMFMSTCSESPLFSFLEFQTVMFRQPLEIISFLLCFLINLTMIVVFIKMIAIIQIRWECIKKEKENKSDQIDKLKELKKHLTGFEVLFEEFKEESILQQAFFCMFIARVYIYVLIIAYLYRYPLLQMILIVFLNISMLAYLYIKRPLKSYLDLAQNILQELILLIGKTSALILAIFDASEAGSQDTRAILGDIVIYCSLALSAVVLLYLAVQIGFFLKYVYDMIIQKKRQKVLAKAKNLKRDKSLSLNGQLIVPVEVKIKGQLPQAMENLHESIDSTTILNLSRTFAVSLSTETNKDVLADSNFQQEKETEKVEDLSMSYLLKGNIHNDMKNLRRNERWNKGVMRHLQGRMRSNIQGE